MCENAKLWIDKYISAENNLPISIRNSYYKNPAYYSIHDQPDND